MNGERYYTFTQGDVTFFALDSNYMDPEQLEWLEKELDASEDRGRSPSSITRSTRRATRTARRSSCARSLEPLFLKYGVDVVFAGHEHFYERIKPQKGIYYFTAAARRSCATGNIRAGRLTAKGFDIDNSVPDRRARQGRPAFPDHLPPRQARGFGHAAADAGAPKAS